MNIALYFFWHLSLCLHAFAAGNDRDDSFESPFAYDESIDNGSWGYYPTSRYVTEEGLNGPHVNYLEWDSRCNDGMFTFITPRGWGIGNPGPMILDQRGDLIWAKHFDNQYGGQAYDFKVQKYGDEDYLTFWLGDDRVRGHGSGSYYMLNASYDVVHRVDAVNGLCADLHEFLITPEGTALLTAYDIIEHDLAILPDYQPDEETHASSYIWDCLFQEVDLKSGDLLFEWRASEHINVTATYRGVGPGGTEDDPFDWIHLNSVEKDELGNYLISARYTHSLTYIDGKTGAILWNLGGRDNDFQDLSGGNATNFAWQHDARLISPDSFPTTYDPPEEQDGMTTTLVSLFDNAAEDLHYDYGLPLSRGLILELTYPTVKSERNPRHAGTQRKRDGVDLNDAKAQDINGTNPDYTVRVIRSYENPQGVRSSSQGSVQVLPPMDGEDSKVLVGYGLNAVWTEFDANGSALCDVHYGAVTSWERGDIQSYRVYKFPWTGMPEQPPVVDISDDDVEVYVSWNGATEVQDWILQCSDTVSSDELSWEDVLRVPKDGFETTITLPDDAEIARYLRVIAIGKNDLRLDYGTSDLIDRGSVASSFHTTNNIISQGMAASKTLMVLAGATSAVIMLFVSYRRLLVWRAGRAHAGALRWRKGFAYRRLGDV